LGPSNRKWRRAKFNRFRLFFRYNSASKIIIYAWINEEDQLRKAGDKNDPYRLFAKQLSKADPPESWEELLRASQELK
jgi:toxin YhaV